ncbi:MAG: hypothetical protein Q4C41_07500 [Eggerthellaceae bacterium]|nr:hypothetical protein [Eggerthellaceae bacterium]
MARAALASGERPHLEESSVFPDGCTVPVHVVVGSLSARTSDARMVAHLHTTGIPDNSFVDVGEPFLLSTPELCFFQAAASLSLPQLIALGFELCGTYAVHQNRPTQYRDRPLTSSARLRSFAARVPSMRGLKKARKALAYVRGGAASPAEAALAMMLCLPYRLGGYGIPWPELNYCIDVPASRKHLLDRSFCIGDACWPCEKLVCEYDSDEFHGAAERRESDERRRNALTAVGYTVVGITRGQLMDSGAFNRLARQIAKILGKRLRYRDPGFTHAHLALRSELFFNSDGWGQVPMR